uniref:Uncharacterized protein n=1 Tax=Anguilla anguilla TaxID=7936 RepID=A0A0E9X1N5_ANGAN
MRISYTSKTRLHRVNNSTKRCSLNITEPARQQAFYKHWNPFHRNSKGLLIIHIKIKI